MAFQKGLEENLLGVAENENENDGNGNDDDEEEDDDKKKKAKRVAVKKEKAEFDNNEYVPFLLCSPFIFLHSF